MNIKGGAQEPSIFGTVLMLVARGYTVAEAITEVESILRCKLPEELVTRIKQECG